MKIPARYAALTFMGSAAVLAAAWLLVPRGIESAGAASATDSLVYNLEGNVVATRKGVSKPAQYDVPVQKGDSFKIAAGGQVDLTAGEYGGFRILGEGELTVTAIQQTNYQIKLDKGTLLGNLKQLPGGMVVEIDTPDAIGRVRVSGSQFVVIVAPDPAKKGYRTRFTVRKGRLESYIKKASAAVNVIEGVSLNLTPDTYIPSTQTATEEELLILKQVNQVAVLAPVKED